jgi:branched-chain amino acid aminotransferase
LFRPDRNAARFNASCRRMCIPEIDPELFLAGVETFVDCDRAWVPQGPASSLYLRPVAIASEAALGVRVSREYLFFVIATPVGPYFPGGFAPVKVMVSTEAMRAANGGTGAAKTAGNYAASLLPILEAKQAGYDQVLFLDPRRARFLEEFGGMNVFVVRDGRLLTPPLGGTILPGITRDSLLTLAREDGIACAEEDIALDDVLAGIERGEVTEVFASGTAAVVTAIGTLAVRGREWAIGGGQVGPVTQRLYRRLTDIQYGRAPDTHGWMVEVPRRSA